ERAVVFAHRAPGAFAEVRTPALPVFLARPRLRQTDLFLCHGHGSGRQIGFNKSGSTRVRSHIRSRPELPAGMLHSLPSVVGVSHSFSRWMARGRRGQRAVAW